MPQPVKLAARQNFREFDFYKKSYAISLEIHKVSLQFPEFEQDALAKQVRQVSKDVCLHIGEGFGRRANSQAEFRRCTLMAIASCSSFVTLADYCVDLGYIEFEMWQDWKRRYKEIVSMLHKLKSKIEANARIFE